MLIILFNYLVITQVLDPELYPIVKKLTIVFKKNPSFVCRSFFDSETNI